MGAFISPDSLIPDPTHYVDYNRYLYARGNPLKYNDPTGHCATNSNGSPDYSDGDCWRWVDTIAASWDGTDYWNDRWGGKDIFFDYIAPTDNDALFFQEQFFMYLASAEYQAYSQERDRQIEAWTQLEKWPAPIPVDAVGIGFGLNIDAPALGPASTGGTVGVEVVAHRNGQIGAFLYGGGGGGMGVGANGKVYVVRIRDLENLEGYSGLAVTGDLTAFPVLAGVFDSPTSATHGEYFGFAPGANISLSASGVYYSQPIWLHRD